MSLHLILADGPCALCPAVTSPRYQLPDELTVVCAACIQRCVYSEIARVNAHAAHKRDLRGGLRVVGLHLSPLVATAPAASWSAQAAVVCGALPRRAMQDDIETERQTVIERIPS